MLIYLRSAIGCWASSNIQGLEVSTGPVVLSALAHIYASQTVTRSQLQLSAHMACNSLMLDASIFAHPQHLAVQCTLQRVLIVLNNKHTA